MALFPKLLQVTLKNEIKERNHILFAFERFILNFENFKKVENSVCVKCGDSEFELHLPLT